MTIEQLREELELSLTWRSDELRMLKNNLSIMRHDEDKSKYRKTLIVMLYSHSHGELIFSEAKSLGIPIVSILDASNDPSEVDYPVFGNFTSIRASKFLFVLLKRVLHLSFRF